MTAQKNVRKITRLNASDTETTTESVVGVVKSDGGVIIKGLFPKEHTDRIRAELKPVFDADIPDPSGFFPKTTRRATGLIGISDACVEYATNKLWIDVCNAILTSTFCGWHGESLEKWTTKPIISSTVGFQIHPGSRAQDLHKDDSDYHPRDHTEDIMLGCLLAVTKSTYENGATLIIPGSHKWSPERIPRKEEAIPAELDVGDVLIFTGNVYHGGGANKSIDQIREVIGMFMVKGMYRPAENQMLAVPPEMAKRFSPQVQRLLGYGISAPSVGFYKYQDPMRVLFGVEDEETVDM
ncbi:hypothetical protein N7481_000197 [Penicillium waksmanii]|uniref:uncharacterized protein n=1 Tax=Penicillium waksmanii TaxID=69791 RepID=UPI00254901A0|nr:uncharacterized protein N7481_000197 [Penicillium waksmanii]KAJ5999788.1 hypothetical protein N7481_000197 [Penicillium waksmanii]